MSQINVDDFRIIRHCIGLLNSMVSGGESHSDISRRMIVKALQAIDLIEQEDSNHDS